ncbi:MAG: hypothetical protein AAF438_04720 [Pseudomonadota bacterium]
MGFLDTKIEYERSKEAEAWIEEEIKEQIERYKKVVADMDALNDMREKWYAEFLERIQTYGFNMDGDQRIKIAPEDIPVKPDGPHKVVY